MHLRRIQLSCPHDIHQHCLENYRRQNPNRSQLCPSCRLPIKTATESAAEYQKFISLYAMTEVTEKEM